MYNHQSCNKRRLNCRMVTTQHTWWHRSRKQRDVRSWARRQNHEKYSYQKGRLHSHPLFVPYDWPDTIGLPLVDDFVKDFSRHAGPLQMVADNALYLLVGECDGMLRKREGIHICRQRCYDYGGSDLVSISAHAHTCASFMSSRRN
jgi:hypothetical protein